MEQNLETRPVEDTVSKVNDEVAVGSDPDFQRKWERWESKVWIILLIFTIASFAGLFGRGPLAKATKAAPDRSITVNYERFQRFGTPSVLDVSFDSSAIQDGKCQLWANDALTKPLGAQRVIPQPASSEVRHGGILYTFEAGRVPVSVEFQTQPSAIGNTHLTLQVPGRPALSLNVFVYP